MGSCSWDELLGGSYISYHSQTQRAESNLLVVKMDRDQLIEYIDAVALPPIPVRKKVWDDNKFVELVRYKTHIPTHEQREWLYQTYGPRGSHLAGQYWEYNAVGDYMVMDEQVYTWFRTKWGSK